MKVGDTMDFRGPVTTLNYEPNAARCLGMIAGGTGITPMYQIIRTVLSNPVRTHRHLNQFSKATALEHVLTPSSLRTVLRTGGQDKIKAVVRQPQPFRYAAPVRATRAPAQTSTAARGPVSSRAAGTK
jgi:ferredoxin-NADP reductase|eukprot:COSAG03_NODE_19_length_21645_cov_17.937532_9_plen_128_part_00